MAENKLKWHTIITKKQIIKTKIFGNNLNNRKKIFKKIEKKPKNIAKTLEKVYITVYNRSVYGLEVGVYLKVNNVMKILYY